jgi:hypothetical protein
MADELLELVDITSPSDKEVIDAVRWLARTTRARHLASIRRDNRSGKPTSNEPNPAKNPHSLYRFLNGKRAEETYWNGRGQRTRQGYVQKRTDVLRALPEEQRRKAYADLGARLSKFQPGFDVTVYDSTYYSPELPEKDSIIYKVKRSLRPTLF